MFRQWKVAIWWKAATNDFYDPLFLIFSCICFLNLFAKIFDSESFENCSIVHNLTQTVRSSACAVHVHETVHHWFAHIHFVDNESFQIWTDFRAATFTCEYRWRWHDQFLADWFIFEWWKNKKPHAKMFILCSFRNDIKCDATEPSIRFTDFSLLLLLWGKHLSNWTKRWRYLNVVPATLIFGRLIVCRWCTIV